MKNKLRTLKNILILAGLSLTNELAEAQAIGLKNPIKASSFQELLTAILNVVVQIGTPVLVLSILWVGFMFIMARGNSTELQKARQAFGWTMIGAAIVIGSKAIAVIIQNTITSLGS